MSIFLANKVLKQASLLLLFRLTYSQTRVGENIMGKKNNAGIFGREIPIIFSYVCIFFKKKIIHTHF